MLLIRNDRRQRITVIGVQQGNKATCTMAWLAAPAGGSRSISGNDYRQKTGILEGNLQAVMANLDKAISEIKTVQAQLADAATQVYLTGTETENWRRQAEESQRMLAELRKLAKPLRISSKSKAS